MNIISILLILGAVHGFLLTIFLLSSRSEARYANRYLAALVFVFSLNLLDTDLFIDEIVSNENLFQVLIWPRVFLYGTFMYLYVRELIFPNKYTLKSWQWLHFLPTLLHIIIIWPLLLIDEERMLTIVLANADTTVDAIWTFIIYDFEEMTGIAHAGLYLFLSLRLLHQHKLFLQNNYSYIDKINLNWLRFLVTSIGSIWLIWAITTFTFDSESISVLINFCLVLLIYSMGYAGLKHPVIYNQMMKKEGAIDTTTHLQMPTTAVNKTVKEAANEIEKYQKSALSFEQSKQLLDELEKLMQEEKFYLDSKLSLPKLAKQLGISANYLSQVINEQKQQSFFDFINSYRIEYAKHRLLDTKNPNAKVITIAMDAGFNSKSSFYMAFRKETGITPSKFRISEEKL